MEGLWLTLETNKQARKSNDSVAFNSLPNIYSTITIFVKSVTWTNLNVSKFLCK